MKDKMIEEMFARIKDLELEIKGLRDCNRKLETKLTTAKVRAERLKAEAESEYRRGVDVGGRHM